MVALTTEVVDAVRACPPVLAGIRTAIVDIRSAGCSRITRGTLAIEFVGSRVGAFTAVFAWIGRAVIDVLIANLAGPTRLTHALVVVDLVEANTAV